MLRIRFDHFDEILLRLSDTADSERIRRLATRNISTRLDGFIKDVGDTQRQILALLRRKIERRSTIPGSAAPVLGANDKPRP